MAIDVLLGAFHRTGDDAALQAAVGTLDAMAAGGIYDHLGGGFARYSVDSRWLVPHFEKMLTDQALLLRAYTHAWQLVGLDRHRTVVHETVEYLRRDLLLPGGAFASSEDADADGVEGSFAVWTPDEIRAVLADDPEAAEAAIAWWDVTEDGNFEGVSILHRLEHRTELDRPDAVERARAALFEAREKRVRPGLDDKVLTEWNALAIAALAEAGVALHEPDWVGLAVAAATFPSARKGVDPDAVRAFVGRSSALHGRAARDGHTGGRRAATTPARAPRRRGWRARRRGPKRARRREAAPRDGF